MFQIGAIVTSPLLKDIEAELLRRPLPMNEYRFNSGSGKSQCFGVVRQRNQTYCGSRMNCMRPALYDLLIRLGNQILPPDFSYVSIQVNQNYETKPHKDVGNKGLSCILGFGDYEGGDLVIENAEISIKNRLCFFDGSLYTHWTKPYTGNRFSIVFHTPARDFREVPVFAFKDVRGELCLTESLQGVVKTYNKKGECIESTDGVLTKRKQRCPTLRACTEYI